jgi:hypothetical protein
MPLGPFSLSGYACRRPGFSDPGLETRYVYEDLLARDSKNIIRADTYGHIKRNGAATRRARDDGSRI